MRTFAMNHVKRYDLSDELNHNSNGHGALDNNCQGKEAEERRQRAQ
jgi:hypothetical protein